MGTFPHSRDTGGRDHHDTRGIMMAGLNIDVFNTGYRPVPSAIPVWPDDRQATWPVSFSSTPRRAGSSRPGLPAATVTSRSYRSSTARSLTGAINSIRYRSFGG